MIEDQVQTAMERLCPTGSRLLVCVSGGIDSVVLLDILCKKGWNIAVAHCNFSLRGEESDGDEAFVRELCSGYGIKCHVKKFDTNLYAKEHGLNTQIAARELRYGYFDELKKNCGYDYIVIAHHLDDDIETFFINLLRGTGLKGLSGIKDSREGIIRPMLSVTRKEISNYAQNSGLQHREDRTNGEDHYIRNRIRHHVIPKLVEISPAFRNTMADNICRLSQARDYIDDSIPRICNDTFNVEALVGNPHMSFVLFELLHPYGFNSAVISQIERAAVENNSGKWFFCSSYKALLEKGTLKIYPVGESYNPESRTINRDDACILPISEAGDYRHLPREIAYLDADKLSFPLKIRKWEAGDRIHPLGMKGSKTIGDFLTDRKVSVAERDQIMVVEDSRGKIAWIVGMQISEEFKIDSRSKYFVKL